MSDRSFKLSLLILILFLAFVASLLIYHGTSRYKQYYRFQETNARITAKGIATEVGLFIAEKQRLVDIFAKDQIKLLAETVKDDSSIEKNVTLLHKRAREYFPDYFALTVLDQDLKPVIDDFDGLIGDMCLQDTHKFLATKNYLTRIHPNPVAYHFDIVSPWQKHKVSGVFFISFHADFLGRLLKGRQIPGHKLLIIDQSANNMIEVTPDGARVNWARDDYRLQEDELAQVLVEIPVQNSRWHVVSLYEKNLFKAEVKRILLVSCSIFMAFAIMVGISIWRLYLEAVRRQQAEQVKNEFISLINHELRTPLTAIRGGLGLIANGVTGETTGKTTEIAHIALSNAEHLGELVDDFLDVQKFSTGKLDLNKQKTQLLPLVKHVLENYKSYADKFGASFTLLPQSDDCEINIDPHRIEQVLANLLSNAAKYGREHDQIEILCECNGNRVRISITDHGKGIPEEFQSRLFHAFEQSSDKRENMVRGTGLGLYIVKAIIQEHNGEIGFITEKDKGSCFWFELPVS